MKYRQHIVEVAPQDLKLPLAASTKQPRLENVVDDIRPGCHTLSTYKALDLMPYDYLTNVLGAPKLSKIVRADVQHDRELSSTLISLSL